jgi:hypothetical protein
VLATFSVEIPRFFSQVPVINPRPGGRKGTYRILYMSAMRRWQLYMIETTENDKYNETDKGPFLMQQFDRFQGLQSFLSYISIVSKSF